MLFRSLFSFAPSLDWARDYFSPTFLPDCITLRFFLIQYSRAGYTYGEAHYASTTPQVEGYYPASRLHSYLIASRHASTTPQAEGYYPASHLVSTGNETTSHLHSYLIASHYASTTPQVEGYIPNNHKTASRRGGNALLM